MGSARQGGRAPELRRVNLAFLGYSISEHATWLAIGIYALQRGGAPEVGFAAAVQLIPVVLLTPFSAYAGDRFAPQRVLAAGYAVQSIAMVATALSMHADGRFVTYAFGALTATAISFTRPVMGSLLPTVTHAPSDLVAANTVAGAIEQFGIFLGPMLTGLVMVTSSPSVVFAIAAVLTGCAAAVTATVPNAAEDRPPMPSGSAAIRQVIAGFTAIRASRTLGLLMLFVAGAGIARGVADVVFVTFADERLDGGGSTAGYLAVVHGLGGLAGAAALAHAAAGRRISSGFVAGAAALSLPLLLLAAASNFAASTPLFLVLGAGEALMAMLAVMTIQRFAPTPVLARIFGIVEGTQMGFVALGSAGVAVVTATWSLGTALVVSGVALGFGHVVTIVLLRRSGDRVPRVDDAVVDRLLSDPVFSGLPAPVVAHLAGAAGVGHVAAGAVIIGEGTAGDRYFLITTGQVSITVSGAPVRVLDAGDSFGEIALLRDVPRTATATAHTDVAVLTVDRDTFLTVVTGHPRSFRTATEIADTRLDPS